MSKNNLLPISKHTGVGYFLEGMLFQNWTRKKTMSIHKVAIFTTLAKGGFPWGHSSPINTIALSRMMTVRMIFLLVRMG
jgi:hypothetical protein